MTDETRSGPLIFGEVLFDRFPDGARVLGGAPFNVAWHLQAFGAAPLFLSRVGVDEDGDRVRDRMRSWGMAENGLQRDPEHPTGAVTVAYEDGEPSYEILEDVAYDFIDASALPDPARAPLLYHGSLAVRADVSAGALRRIKADGPPVFIDVNLRDPWWRREQVLSQLDDATWAKLNEDELRLLGGDAGHDIEAAAAAFRERHALDMLVVTLGARGALAMTSGETAQVRPASDVRVIDPVGAGDSFASVLILGLLHRWPLSQTLERAQSFASLVVGRQGATVDSRDFYLPFIEDWGLL